MDFSSKAKSSNVRWVGIASELWVDCAARLIIIFANMLNSLTHTQRDTAQKGASSASKSILPAVNIQVMAPTYHGKACGSHATLSSESGSINYFQMHSIQFGDLEPLNLQIFVPASLSASPGYICCCMHKIARMFETDMRGIARAYMYNHVCL